MPTESILTQWAKQVPVDFIFAFKAPQIITHLKRLKNVDTETEYLFRTLAVLEERLGPVLFQFPKSFHADPLTLEKFIALIPDAASCAFEFRNSSPLDDEVIDLLREKKCSLCVLDSDEKPATQIVSTAPRGYLRLRRSDYTNADLSQWGEKITAQKWKKAFVFFKHEEEAKGPELASRFRELTKASKESGQNAEVRL